MPDSLTRHRYPSRAVAGALAVVAGLALAACSGAAPGPAAPSSPAGGTPTSSGTTPASTSPGSATSAPATTPTTATPTGPPLSAAERCAHDLVADMSADEQAGQLLMVGLDVNAGRASLDDVVRDWHLGGVILLGGWFDGAAPVRETTSHLEGLAGRETAGLDLFLAADQEGGNVQQLRGDGFTRIPTARVQNDLSPSQLAGRAADWAKEIRAAGINVNLAPVADTVPVDIGRANDPIGQWDRQFSSDPDENSRMVGGFIKGMHAGGVAATIKHFPGLGRITGNTDITSEGITDGRTTVTDAYLRPFASGIKDGADFVMVGSAIYDRIDPGVNAVFSKRIITDLLRTRMGYDGVVITDDVGAAKAVAHTPAGQRATRFVEAGGDVVLTARPDTIPTMHQALTERMDATPSFAAQVERAAIRVVTLKVDMDLATC